MKKLLQYSNPTKPKPIITPADEPVLGPSEEWETLTIIEENDGLFYLLSRYTNGWQGDTCHFSVEEAKRQAKFGYGVDENAWENCFDK